MSDYKINKTDAEWKSQLSDEQYRILRKKERKCLSQGYITAILKRDHTAVRAAKPHCLKAKPSLTAAVAGQVLMLQLKET